MAASRSPPRPGIPRQMAGLKPGRTFQGRSFLPILKDPSATIQDHIFAEHNWHDFDDHGRAVRSDRFKYIRNYYADFPGTPPADAVRSITFQAMRKLRDQGKLTPAQLNPFVKPRPAEELYDMLSDPHELRNLADNPEYAFELRQLKRKLQQWERRTKDAVPQKRRLDEFDRETGERLEKFRKPAKKKSPTKTGKR